MKKNYSPIKTFATGAFVLAVILLLASCNCPTCGDCSNKTLLDITDLKAKPDPSCPSLVDIESRITGLNPSTDAGRKVTVHYEIHSFIDTAAQQVNDTFDIIIGTKAYVAGAGNEIVNTGTGARRFVTNETDHDTRLAAISKAKAEGRIKLIQLYVTLYQDNRPCSSDVVKKENVTASF